MNSLKVKAAIVERGYTQSKLAKEMNMSINTLNFKLNGRSDLTVPEMWQMCQILQIPKERVPEIFLP